MSTSIEQLPVRLAGRGDAPALAAIDQLVSPNPWSVVQFEAPCGGEVDSSDCALVLEQAGQLMGFVVFTRLLDEASIHNIAIHPSWQGRGLGLGLLNSALEQVKSEGAARCYLEVRASNRAARVLYTRLSFRVDGVRRNYYSSPPGREDAVLMSKQL